MIDVHSHILYGVENGPATKQEAANIIKEAAASGVKTMVTVYNYNANKEPNSEIDEKFLEMSDIANKYDIDLKLGCKFLFTPIISDIATPDKVFAINGAKYILMDYSLGRMPAYLDTAMYNLRLKGIIPIIVHPERNEFFMSSNILRRFIRRDCLVQVDAASIMGLHGMKVRNFAKKLLKRNMVHFIGSNTNNPVIYSKYFLKASMKASKWAGRKVGERIILDDAKITVEEAHMQDVNNLEYFSDTFL